MIVRPMIGGWSPPSIERIRAVEARRLAVLPVPGLSGDLHQDLGRSALGIEIIGSLNTDDARDDFLEQIREKFLLFEIARGTPAWALAFVGPLVLVGYFVSPPDRNLAARLGLPRGQGRRPSPA